MSHLGVFGENIFMRRVQFFLVVMQNQEIGWRLAPLHPEILRPDKSGLRMTNWTMVVIPVILVFHAG